MGIAMPWGGRMKDTRVPANGQHQFRGSTIQPEFFEGLAQVQILCASHNSLSGLKGR